MSSHLRIESVSEVMAAGSRLASRGDQLAGEMSSALAAVRALDTDASFPRDKFTDTFLVEYRKELPGGDGMPGNEAVKENVEQMGKALGTFGRNATNAMTAYTITDDGNAEDIAAEVAPGSEPAGPGDGPVPAATGGQGGGGPVSEGPVSEGPAGRNRAATARFVIDGESDAGDAV